MGKIEGWLDQEKGDDWRDDDLATVRAGDVEREIGDDSTSITIRRAGSNLSAQSVRLLQPPARGQEQGSMGGEEGQADLVVLGTSSFDVQRGDRFLVDASSGELDQLYEVIYVAPGQSGRVEAKARQVQ